MRFTLEQVVEFCWKNKRHRCFKNFEKAQIALSIIWAFEENKLHLVKDPEGLCGVAILSHGENTTYCHHVVAVRTGFHTLIKQELKDYPNNTIQGFRGGKILNFNKRLLCQISGQAIHHHS